MCAAAWIPIIEHRRLSWVVPNDGRGGGCPAWPVQVEHLAVSPAPHVEDVAAAHPAGRVFQSGPRDPDAAVSRVTPVLGHIVSGTKDVAGESATQRNHQHEVT